MSDTVADEKPRKAREMRGDRRETREDVKTPESVSTGLDPNAWMKAPIEYRTRDDGSIEAVVAGEILSRSISASDPFEFDRGIIPEGWDYQWRRWTVVNQNDPTYEGTLLRNGWKHVMYENHPGMFGPSDMTGPVRTQGLQLMRRPMIFTQQAIDEQRRETKRKTIEQRKHFEVLASQGREGQVIADGTRTIINSSVVPVKTVGPQGAKSFPVE